MAIVQSTLAAKGAKAPQRNRAPVGAWEQKTRVRDVVVGVNEPIGGALGKVFGIGRTMVARARRRTSLAAKTPVGRVRQEDRARRAAVREREGHAVGTERKKQEGERRATHLRLGTYKGRMRRRGLPMNGQRTSTNAKTAKKRNAGRLRGRGVSTIR